MSQLSLIRSAIAAFLQAHGASTGGDIIANSRSLRGSRPGVASVSGRGSPVAEPVVEQGPVVEPVAGQGSEPVVKPVTESVAEPVVEPVTEPAPEPDQSTEPVPDPTVVPGADTPAPKRPRGRKGRA